MSSRRSGGRSAVVRGKVLAAAKELVAKKGPQNVTMPEVAQLAGVAATSLYRRWGNINSVLLEMAADQLSKIFPVPDEGSIQRDLELWTERIALGLDTTEGRLLRILVSATELQPEERFKALAPRIEQLEAMIDRSKARGEKTPTIDEIFDHVIAPLTMRALLGRPVDEALAKDLVRRLLKD